MTCDKCHKGYDGKTYEIAGMIVCGICSITMTGRAPGFVGQNHPREVNPDKYEPAKEQALAIEWMEKQPHDSRSHIDYRTAARWKKVFVDNSEKIDAQKAKTPEWYGKVSEDMHKSARNSMMDTVNRRVKKAETALKKIDEAVRMNGIPK